MKEVELKILNIDKKKITAKLRNIGARKIIKRTLIREIYFEKVGVKNYTHNNYSSLRLRSIGKNNELTVKIKEESGMFGIWKEIETTMGDFETAKSILETIGFKPFRVREKYREEYMFKNIKIEIDTYPKMNPYVEIEAKSEVEMMKFLEEMQFPIEYATKETATEIIKRSKLNPDNLVFTKKKNASI